MRLSEEIDRSFGDGPAHRPVEDRLTAGRSAVRRRRGAVAVAALATVGILGTAYAVAGPGAGGDASPVANDPSAKADPTHDPQDELVGGQLATYDAGELIIRDGARVVRTVDNPLDLRAPDTSVGLVLEYRGEKTWMLLDWETDGKTASSGASSEEAGRVFSTFDLWLADMVALQQGDETLSLAEFTPVDGDETLIPGDGVELLAQLAHPQLPANFAPDTARTAVAKVRWQGDIWFVLARDLADSPPEYFPTEASVAGGAGTIDEFVDHARRSYLDEEGLR